MKQMLLIFNPAAGKRQANRYLPDIIGSFNRAGYLVQVHISAGSEDICRAVRQAENKDLVVCCGGDGTLNQTINGLLSAGLSVPLGYIPAGSTNDFAASLGLPTRIPAAVKTILEGRPHCYDVGRFQDRYFSYVASFGAFTRASYATSQSVKNALGHTAYLLEGIQELSQIRRIHARLELDGQTIEDDFIFGAISNSTSVGGVLTLDPRQVDMCDGKLEVLLIRAPRDFLEISECIRALQTQVYNCSMLTFCSASRICIQSSEEMVWTLDGERMDVPGFVEVRNLHNAITLIK